jgi:hypothetical protein
MNFKLATTIFVALGFAILSQTSPAAYPRCKGWPSCCRFLAYTFLPADPEPTTEYPPLPTPKNECT